MENLQAQLQRIQAQIAQEEAKGAAERNDARIAQLRQDEADILAQMDEAKKQAQEAAIEEKVHAEGVPFAIDGVDFTQLPAELITVIELVVKADRRRIYAEHAAEVDKLQEEHEQDEDEHRNEIIARDDMLNHIQEKLDEINSSYADVTGQLEHQKDLTAQAATDLRKAIAERDEARQNRDNAARQLTEANAEIARLKSQIDDYQKAKVFGERESQNVIEAAPQEAEAINAAIQKLYVSIENWGSTNKVVKPDGTFELVKNKDLDEWSPITPPTLGGSESADSFRDESEQDSSAVAGDDRVQDIKPPVGSFREDEDAQHTVGGDAAVREVVGAPTREEFEALKERVSKLEQGATGAAA